MTRGEVPLPKKRKGPPPTMIVVPGRRTATTRILAHSVPATISVRPATRSRTFAQLERSLMGRDVRRTTPVRWPRQAVITSGMTARTNQTDTTRAGRVITMEVVIRGKAVSLLASIFTAFSKPKWSSCSVTLARFLSKINAFFMMILRRQWWSPNPPASRIKEMTVM